MRNEEGGAHAVIDRRNSKSHGLSGRLWPDSKHAPYAAVRNEQAFTQRDMSAQRAWLAQRALSRGYANLDDLFCRAPAAYIRLAVMWRQTHPPPGKG